jgi:O-antigen/teichoic acid export membrane protein
VASASRDTLPGQVRRAAAWSTLDVAVNRTGGFLLGIIVARLLAPHDFGVYAVALVVHTIIISISDLGLGWALVRDDEEAVAATAPTITTMAIANSVVLGALMALSAPLLAGLLGAPHATATIQVMALTLPLAGLAAVPSALLRREFRMDRMFVADTANTIASAVIVVPLALAGWGPLALAFSFVAGQVLTTIMVTVYSPRRYRPGWDAQQARALLRFGMPLVGASILVFSIQNVDYIVVGRLLGPVALGLYVLAFNISGWPQNVFGTVVRNVSLPAFSRMREGGSDMAQGFVGALRMVSRLIFPVCLFLGALAPHLVRAVYGAKWEAASHALIGLSVFAAGRTIMELFADFLVSLGRTRAVLLVQVIWLPVLTALLLVLVKRFGIAGAGAAHATVAVLVVVPAYVYMVSRAEIRPAMVARALIPTISLALLAALVAWAVSSRVAAPLLACVAGGGAGFALYVTPYLSELREAFANERSRRRSERTAIAESAA